MFWFIFCVRSEVRLLPVSSGSPPPGTPSHQSVVSVSSAQRKRREHCVVLVASPSVRGQDISTSSYRRRRGLASSCLPCLLVFSFGEMTVPCLQFHGFIVSNSQVQEAFALSASLFFFRCIAREAHSSYKFSFFTTQFFTTLTDQKGHPKGGRCCGGES